jgi:hypothetical protein
VLRGGAGIYYDTVTVVSYWRAILHMKEFISAQKTLVNPAIGVGDLATYRYGIDPVPGPPANPTNLERGGRSIGQWISPSHQDPSTIQFNLGLSHEITNSLVFGADFVHSAGRHEFKPQEINPIIRPGVRRLDEAFGNVLGDPALFGSIRIATADGRSQFDMLNLKLEQRGARATYRISYELGRAYAYGGSIAGNGVFPQDQDDPFGPGEWGPSANDERHRVVVTAVLDGPYGLQVAPVFQAATARAYNLTSGTDRNGDGQRNDRYIPPGSTTPVSVNSGRGDPILSTDVRVTKFINLQGEQRRIALFAEFFNVFNTVNFGNLYQGNALSPNFMQPTGLMYGVGIPFQAQFGARFIF